MNDKYTLLDVPDLLLRLEGKINGLERIIKDKKEPEKPNFIRIDELSQKTGWAVQTIYGMVSRRKIPFIKRGRNVYFDEARIDQWILEGQFEPVN